MGLGSTTKKIQTIADKAEQVYAQLNEVREQLEDLRTKVETTTDTVAELEVKHEQNRALLEALVEEQGIDPETVITEASIDDAEEPDSTPDRAAGNDTAGEPEEPAATGPETDAAGTETS